MATMIASALWLSEGASALWLSEGAAVQDQQRYVRRHLQADPNPTDVTPLPSWAPPTEAPSVTPRPTITPRPTASPSITPIPTMTGRPTILTFDDGTLKPIKPPHAVVGLSRPPTESPAPSPSPSRDPTTSPSHSLKPTTTPTLHPTDTSEPTPSPSSDPSMSPTTPKPTHRPTSKPTTTRPTLEPTPAPTQKPTTKPTPQPTRDTTPRPTPSPRPTTKPPTFLPSSEPSTIPSLLPSLDPASPSHSITPSNTEIPTVYPTTTTQPTRTHPPSTSPSQRMLQSFLPSARQETVELTAFAVAVAFLTPLDDAQITQAAEELNVVTADFLMQQLMNSSSPVEVDGFDLTASFVDNTTFVSQLRRRRRLQQEIYVYNYSVDGTAQVTTSGDNAMLARTVDNSINSVFDDPNSQAQFTSYVQTHPDSSVLTATAGSLVQTQPPQDNGGKTKPSTWQIAVGFGLVGLAALLLLFYAHQCLRKCRKQRLAKQRERQGVQAVTSFKTAPPPAGFLASSNVAPTAGDENDESSVEYEGISESDNEDLDAFAQELKLAATLDKRSWEDYQRKRRELDQTGRVMGGAGAGLAAYDAVTAQDEEEEQGFEVEDTGSRLIIEAAEDGGDYKSAISGTTFPYGDEGSRKMDPPARRGSQIMASRSRVDDPAGVRGSQLQFQQSYMDEGANVTPAKFLQDSAESRRLSIVDNEGQSDYDQVAQLMGSLTASAAVAKARENPRKLQPQESVEVSITSTDTIAASQDFASKSRSLPVSRPPTANVTKEALFGNGEDPEQIQSKDSGSLQSLLTIDVIKEVQKLSQFVRKYEQKREEEKKTESARSISRPAYDSSEDEPESDDYSDAAESSGSSIGDDYFIRRGPLQRSPEKPSAKPPTLATSRKSPLEVIVPKPSTKAPTLEKSHKSPLKVVVPDDYDDQYQYDGSVDDDEGGIPDQGSQDSRLGINPFSVHKVEGQPNIGASKQRIIAQQNGHVVSKPTSRVGPKPPVTGNKLTSTVLSPIAGTPNTPPSDEGESPKKRRTDFGYVTRDSSTYSPPIEVRVSPYKSSTTSKRQSPRSSEPVNSRLAGRDSEMEGRRGDYAREPSHQHARQEQSPGNNMQNQLRENSGRIGASRSPLPPKPPSASRKTLHTLRQRDAIIDGDPEALSAVHPSDEERTRGESPQPGRIKTTPRKSINKGFNNIISMFESKPKNSIFPPSENWQYER